MAARIEAPAAYEDDDDYEDSSNGSLIATAAHLALKPVRPFFSRPALRAYLTTIFAALTAFTLLGLAIIAYLLFYSLYIPRIGFARPLHLQYDHILLNQQSPAHDLANLTPHPWATTTLTPDISASQQYDITLDITLPHTPSNREAGNFMLDVQLLATSSPLVPVTSSDILARSRLPALLPYRSRPVRLLQLLLSLPQYTFGFRSESTTLSIPAFNHVEFSKGWRTTPSTLRLEVQSIHVLQIEKVEVNFRARFRGLRWLMYNFRIAGGVVFVGLFWGVECLFAGLAWCVLAMYFSSSSSQVEEPKTELKKDVLKRAKEIKEEGEQAAMSDTERTFPSRTGAGVVRYSSDSGVKKEIKQEEEVDVLSIPEHVAKAAEADVEDEGEDSGDLDFRDSGIGTSVESEATLGRRDSMRRRQKRGRPESKD